MIHLKEISMICGDNLRTKAYLQILLKNNIKINKCLIMSTEIEKMEKEETIHKSSIEKGYFDVKEPLLLTLKKNNIDFEIIPTKSINDKMVIKKLEQEESQYFIYSGYAGEILKESLFKLGKKYIHCHPGILPTYRGSTTIYYSILKEKKCGVSVMFLNSKIDEGNILFMKEYLLPPQNVSIDIIYDSYIRGLALMECLKNYINNSFKFLEEKQSNQDEEIYYIIHPVLKYKSLKRLKENEV